MNKNLHTYNTLEQQINLMKKFKFQFNKTQRCNLQSIDNDVTGIINNIDQFNTNYSDNGWCIYDSIDITLVANANNAHSLGGLNEGEQVLLKYYCSEDNLNLSLLKNKSNYFLPRFSLIKLAFDDHFAERYHASIPVFLLIIDGTLNDYSKNKGFFNNNLDLTNWDCLVGCDGALPKIKDIFNKSRKKTTTHPITLPYRNGILHGRDINYNNALVSCKCITLLYALADWLSLKDNQDKRKDEYSRNFEQPSLTDLYSQIRDNNMIKKEVKTWKKRTVIIGTDISEVPSNEDCKTYPYISPFIDMFNTWNNKNYGLLSNLLKEMFINTDNEKYLAGECRTVFQNKTFKEFKLIEIEERACALVRLSFEVSWFVGDTLYVEILEFGCRYSSDNQTALPWRNNGNWIIIPWNISGLYK